MGYIEQNAAVLEEEMTWLKQVIDTRLAAFYQKDVEQQDIFTITPPVFGQQESTYAWFVHNYRLSFAERLLLALSLAPNIRPDVLDPFYSKNSTYDRAFSEFGGLEVEGHKGFLPTGETLSFLLADRKMEPRFHMHQLFDVDHFFAKSNVVRLEPLNKHHPFLGGLLKLSQEYIEYFTLGTLRKPDFSPEFPAKRIFTRLDWDDVVLRPHTKAHIMEIKDWIEYGHILLNGWGLAEKLKPGYKALFYGPPGTGKTLTASLLGKYTKKDVYKIDLSLIVSKYIGETEKNLAKVFDKAENRGWILFFDEADALFGKRTETQSSHDRYANQEVAYLLQRIEDYAGLVILASNLKDNIDQAFMRRFQSIVHFPMPGAEERLEIWKKAFSKKSMLEEGVNLKKLAEAHELSGALIMNVVQYASIRTLKRKSHEIKLLDIEQGIKRELFKDGITLI